MYPLSYKKHKSHIFLLGKSILQHSIESFLDGGFEVHVITSPSYDISAVLDADIIDRVNFIYQDKPLGVGHALSLIKDYVDDLFFVSNGYHLLTSNLKEIIKKVSEEKVFLKKTSDFSKYGMARIKEDKVVDVVEKPQKWDFDPLRLIGFYVLSKDFLRNYLLNENFKRDHYSFESALKKFANEKGISYSLYEEEIPSLKYPWDYFSYFNYLVRYKYGDKGIYVNGSISEKAILDDTSGPIIIEGEVKENSIIRGPAYVGEKTIVGNHVLIRDSDVECCSKLGYNSEIVRSVIQKNASIHGSYIGDSVLDENFRSGFGFVTANRRLDRKNIKVVIKGKLMDTGLDRLGVISGSNVSVGSNSTTMPGTVIMPKTTIYPNVRVKGVLEGIISESNF